MELNSRYRVDINEEEVEDNPRCIHGPMLKFIRENAGQKSEFYGCSACRNKKDCPGPGSRPEDEQRCFEDNLRIHREIQESSKFYCFSCKSFSADLIGHRKCSTTPVNDRDLPYPTEILSPNSRDKTEAQYFFTEETVKDILKIVSDLKFNKVICLGTPRLHENFKKSPGLRSLLLDFDDRLRHFYPPEEFLKYNMFNHYFFNGAHSRSIFSEFLKNDSKRDKVCLIVDPPFGCRTEALTFTLKRIQSEYLTLNKEILSIIWVFPYFMENYVTKSMPEMKMLDYKVNYTNHSSYNDSGRFGSPVRLFTNILPKLIRFGKGFKFCAPCDKFTRLDNPHCKPCNSCPSNNGAIYRHCLQCATCVKPYYVHCPSCNRCVQKEDHECTEYQLNAFCWICDEKGHVERNCLKKPNQKVKVNSKSASRTCAICRKLNHNERQCRGRSQLEAAALSNKR